MSSVKSTQTGCDCNVQTLADFEINFVHCYQHWETASEKIKVLDIFDVDQQTILNKESTMPCNGSADLKRSSIIFSITFL